MSKNIIFLLGNYQNRLKKICNEFNGKIMFLDGNTSKYDFKSNVNIQHIEIFNGYLSISDYINKNFDMLIINAVDKIPIWKGDIAELHDVDQTIDFMIMLLLERINDKIKVIITTDKSNLKDIDNVNIYRL